MLRSCIIIEDQAPAQRILQKYIKDIGTLDLKGTFSDAVDAIVFLQQNTIDLIFLDIHLPKISGMDFLKTLQHAPQVILTTAFSEYALESYEYNVVDYLLKPYSFQRFIQAVSKSVSLMKPSTEVVQEKMLVDEDHFFIKTGHDLVKVNTREILYFTSDEDYVKIVTRHKSYLSSDSLKTWLSKLTSVFCQVHKSYIINTKHIERISGNQIYLTNGTCVPIGRAYKEYFVATYLND
ncbi:LytTR family DNA-binding domain-containing protein [uncultured Kordia sp.]|uniref:LytR/AlgR family response regulator transcription factor n=1 Tax=uncultured Kordia sp. TaxID=507699 RepID=UPI00262DD0B1|nr:LytTR family DNA-binding domain-containing protein [uncultured Kordia sp.]